MTVAVLILNWAEDEEALIETHHCLRIRKLCSSDRSEIVVTPKMEAVFIAIAPAPTRRVMTVLLETGLRIGDACRLSRSHVQPTPAGRRLSIRTAKRKRIATIPATTPMAGVLDDAPEGRPLTLVTEGGRPFTRQRMSRHLKWSMRKAGRPDHVKPMDTHGAAAKRLLMAGPKLSQIAAHMGWSLRYAAGAIEHNTAVVPEMADEILVTLEMARR
ncbi:MAG: tyrosine-type recombinase/integrase [Pseudomonadota bacterium]